MGFGRTAPSVAEVLSTPDTELIAKAVGQVADGGGQPNSRGVIARGLGRSYGDNAQNGGGLVIDMTPLNKIHSIDSDTRLAEVDAGVSLDQLMKAALPFGLWVPVLPGTRQVTVGGAIAADVHGKNHHVAGSFARHVLSFDLLLPSGQSRTYSPTRDSHLFWATCGGMGLTGLITQATIQLKRVEASRVKVDTVRTADIGETMAVLAEHDKKYGYTVAWSDSTARGKAVGRSVITSGDFAALDDLPGADRGQPFAFDPRARLGAPDIFPSGLLNRYSITLANEVWYRKAPRLREGEIQTIGQFFHPLDGIRNWNRVYGPKGFRQYQYVLPFGAEDAVRKSFEMVSAAHAPSFVTVLKRFGAGNAGLLSFPMPGWTLALDFPGGTPGLSQLCDALDRLVVDNGGRVYLAKDSRVSPGMLEQMYPRLAEFREIRAELDPDGVFGSDLSRRLKI
jgi:decaprenylphospho-beta-D-ribofuranose 2-oxidase